MKKFILFLTLAALLAYFICAYVTFDRTSNEHQIISAIEKAARGIEQKNMSMIFECVSRSYKDDSGINYEKARMLVAQALSSDSVYSVSLNFGNIYFESDFAKIEVLPHIFENKTKRTIYNRKFTLVFKQEKAKHAWFIPIKKWRVISSSDIGFSEF